MPFWRDKLTGIAYEPYTRVDIRRMHKLGLLSDEELLKAHRDLGYDDEHARNLSEFVRRLNSAPEEEAVGELGKLSRSSILSFYRDGLLDREHAVSLLADSGISQDAAALYVQQVDVDVAQAERHAEAALVVELAVAGEITQQVARDRLNSLGLGATETEKILSQLYRKLTLKVKLPSRAEGEQMLEAGIITEQAYTALLATLGYSDKWAQAFLSLVKAKGQKKARA
jgi:hypothetical protein